MFCWVPFQSENMKMKRNLNWFCYHCIWCWSQQITALGLNLPSLCMAHNLGLFLKNLKGWFKKLKRRQMCVMAEIACGPQSLQYLLSAFYRSSASPWSILRLDRRNRCAHVTWLPWTEGGRMHWDPRSPPLPGATTPQRLPEECIPWRCPEKPA